MTSTGLRGLRNISVKPSEKNNNCLKQIFGRIFGIRPEWGWDGRTGRTDGNTVLQYYWDGEIQCTVLKGLMNISDRNIL